MEVWYILMIDNVSYEQPEMVVVANDCNIQEFWTAVKEGEFKEILSHTKSHEMDIWKCRTLTLDGFNNLDELDERVRHLKFSSNDDSDCEKLVPWTSVMGLELSEYQPLIVTVSHEGLQRFFLHIMFPAELTYVLNS